MCRKLVERATHPEHLTRLVNELGGDWQAHRLTVMGTESAARRIGSLNLACWDKPFSDPDVLFPSGRSERQVRTRLGEDDRLADFDPAPSGPFGEPLHRLTIPAHLAIGVPNDARVEEVDASDGSVSFRLANQRFRYDRLGLRRSGTQPKEDDLDD